MRKRRLRQGRADAGVVAKQKRVTFLPGEVFFSLTCPLMGDPFLPFLIFKSQINHPGPDTENTAINPK